MLTSGASPCNPLFQNEPLAGDQALKHINLWCHFHVQNSLPLCHCDTQICARWLMTDKMVSIPKPSCFLNGLLALLQRRCGVAHGSSHSTQFQESFLSQLCLLYSMMFSLQKITLTVSFATNATYLSIKVLCFSYKRDGQMLSSRHMSPEGLSQLLSFKTAPGKHCLQSMSSWTSESTHHLHRR